MKVYEGERQFAKDNYKLGDFVIKGVPPAKKGAAKIEVTLHVDSDGILNLSAVDKLSGKSDHLTISDERVSFSSKEVAEMTKTLADQEKEIVDRIVYNYGNLRNPGGNGQPLPPGTQTNGLPVHNEIG